MNRLDSELMLGALTSEGYETTEDPLMADLVLLNTCSVRAHAEDKVYSLLGRLRRVKQKRPEVVIGILGCMAQKDADRIKRRVPIVDLILGPSQIDHLPRFVREIEGSARGAVPVVATEHKPVAFARDVKARPARRHAFVEVIRGCDVMCTFCVVPFTRGPEVSRSPEEVVAEVEALAADGVREVTLLGQTIDHYGKDLRRGIGLGDLLTDVAAVEKIWRVRFITSHPRYLDDSILQAVANEPKVCPYLHMPLQSGSDSVLARMKRKYDVARYTDRVERARELIGEVSIASDFIVGFPGETEDDFQASVRCVEKFRFSNSFIFKYSPREGTPAHDLVDDVPLEVKKRRNNELLEVQNRIREEENRSMIGRTVDVLIEGVSKRDSSNYTGRTPGHQIVCVPADPEWVGRIVPVRITHATVLTLFGEVEVPAPAHRD